ncbi:Aste57867_7545 [Aphanomyces stellatus]|uniref:Aste57867_4632 protein n=1 Tax=Aphanomyces stellatus TaxID=120398 RepID=A0A485KFQ2_9STRA|nr:hypothetical protein As57867_007519 [Aphanomyces stellatus]KAF0712852.1 hypothetical protein As57867_004619 [Aphanomyces stellatus]VFT81736.1 Aste57867_4632 [Aphanomyces stellatus]VFT84454.1 Aste57867_7545 [Aphanomyces stellatus]
MVVELLSMCNYADFLQSESRRTKFRAALSEFQATMQSPSGTWDPRLRQFMEAALIYPIEDAIDNGRPFDMDMALNEIYGLKAHYKQTDGSREADTLFRKLFFGIEAFRVFNNSTAHHQQGQGRGLPSSDVIDEQFQLHWKVHLDLAMRTIVHYIVWIHKEIRTKRAILTEPEAEPSFEPRTSPAKSVMSFQEHTRPASPTATPTMEFVPSPTELHFAPNVPSMAPACARPRLNSAPPMRSSSMATVPPISPSVARVLQHKVVKELRQRTERGLRPRFFTLCQQSYCTRGCNMAHSANDMKVIGICRVIINSGWKRTQCNQRANCPFGASCDFIHPNDDINLIQEIKRTSHQLEPRVVFDGTSKAMVRFGNGVEVQIMARN